MSETFRFGDLSVDIVVSPPPWYENCYVVRHVDGTVLVVDPGGDAPAILRRARAGDAKPAAVLLTHGHFDHLGAARAVQSELELTVHAHADERAIISGASRLAATWVGQAIDDPDPVEYFADQPTLRFGGISVAVIHTPGHTPGGVCYAFDGFVLTGDTLFNQGVGRTDLPGGDTRRLVASIGQLLNRLPDDATLFSGHGPEWTVAEARPWWEWMGRQL